ncbi:MAG: PAS domain S-box protein [Acetobacteraceae bacterium]|nr:PAS domain S-box protein [Acetobacteraceae bacterium]
MAHAADAAAEYARRLLDGQLLRIEFAEELLNGLSDAEIRVREPELHARLRRGVASGAVSDAEGPPSGLHVLVHDRNAFPLVSSARPSVQRDRPYIDPALAAEMRVVPPGEVRITPVYPGRDTGRQFFSLARRREHAGNRLPEGEFDGFIVASAYVDAVADALRRLAPSAEDAVALVRADGAVLARSMGFEPGRPVPRLGPDNSALAAMRRGEARAARVGRSTADGRERIAAYRRVEGWPVYAAAGRDRAVVAARWRAGALPLLGLGLAATGLLAALTLLVRRKQEELAAANAGLEGRVAERTAALVASERRNREVLDSLGDLLYALDRDGRVRFASRSLLKGWGLGEERVLGRHLLELWPPLVGSLVWEAVRRGIEAREESHLCTVSPVLGRWVEMDVHPPGDGGVTVAVRDVHDLREAEIERRRAEGELRDLLATLDLGAIMARDLDGTVRFWSAGCERLYGWSAAEAAGRSAHALLATRFPVPVAEVEAALLHTGEWRGDLRQRRRDGSEVVVSAHKSLRCDAAGRPVAVAENLTDVTALRRAEEQLRASEERLRLAQEVGGIGAWELDLRTGERHWSDSGYRMWGLEPGEPITRDVVLSLIVPEDRAEAQAAIEQADS